MSTLLPLTAVVQAAEVECTIVVRSEPRTLLITPSKTPYDVTKIEFDNGFRFSGQVLENPQRLKTYTYFDSKDRYVLIHEGIVSLDEKSCGRSLGDNTVYSPRLEIELSYNCKLKCE
jgi:hypothetical protein